MSFDAVQLATLVCIADHGSFESAARELHVTPSAVSQRIRALEQAAGQVVVRRGTPCVPTETGAVLVRLGRQTRLLYDEARSSFAGHPATPIALGVAVNADSLATWFRDVLAEAAQWPSVALRLRVEDQAFTAERLRSGDVLAAVTSDPVAVQGCSVEPIGTLRYLPAAAPSVVARWHRSRGLDWERMPMVVYDARDTLQHDLLVARGVGHPVTVHEIPSATDFHAAVRCGLGWGMLPEPQAAPDLADGTLVRIAARDRTDVLLHWQRWRLDSPALTRLTSAVRHAARSHLR